MPELTDGRQVVISGPLRMRDGWTINTDAGLLSCACGESLLLAADGVTDNSPRVAEFYAAHNHAGVL